MKINLIYFLICVSISLGTSEVVSVNNFSFSPNHLDIDVGETVAEVNFSHLNADEISDTAESFYESEKALMDECRNDIEEFAFLICEAYYEINFEGQ